MIAIPAVDLRDGACVQLVGGEYAAERVRLDDAVAVAAGWVTLGFSALHLVDLDAATGRGDNAALVGAIVSAAGVPVQVGGGVRTAEDIERLLALGAVRVVVGTRALEDPAWLERAAAGAPGRLVVAVDVRERCVVTRGWTHTLPDGLESVLARLDELPLAGLLVTAVHREGRMEGPDVELTREVAGLVRQPVHASGGIAGIDDLRALSSAGAAAAVVGMALYTGALDARQAAREFAAVRTTTR
ncbi:MAG TPA: HisA/HisF-related TIM barrel protein [Gemmatimonadaceae bacterium]|nr:HisA/HisF-related TIM barrel protein [Gemmatimonadaceae bacterium]